MEEAREIAGVLGRVFCIILAMVAVLSSVYILSIYA